jgi:hypothetical protein
MAQHFCHLYDDIRTAHILHMATQPAIFRANIILTAGQSRLLDGHVLQTANLRYKLQQTLLIQYCMYLHI